MPRQSSTIQVPYLPYEMQAQAHAARGPVVGFFGGYGSGKTQWVIGEALRNSMLLPGGEGMLCSANFRSQPRTLYKKIVETFPEAKSWPRGNQSARSRLGPLVRDWSSREKVLTLDIGKNGTRWHFTSAEAEDSMEGGEFDWAVGDELRLWSHSSWFTFLSRIRNKNPLNFNRISLSSVPEMGWMYTEFGTNTPGRDTFKVPTWANPHLPEGYIERLRLSGRMAQAFIGGEFVHLEGSVYETYEPGSSREGDVGSTLPIEPEPGRLTYGMADFGYRRPAFAVLQKVPLPYSVFCGAPGLPPVEIPAGTVVDVIVAEVVMRDVQAEVHARRCGELLQSYGLVMDECWCDPAGDQADQQTGIPVVAVYEQVFEEMGVLAHPGLSWTTDPIERSVARRNETVRWCFQDHVGARRLFMAERLTQPEYLERLPRDVMGMHQSLLGYSYPKNAKKGNDRPDKDGVHDHFPDALEALIVGQRGVFRGPALEPANEESPSALYAREPVLQGAAFDIVGDAI